MVSNAYQVTMQKLVPRVVLQSLNINKDMKQGIVLQCWWLSLGLLHKRRLEPAGIDNNIIAIALAQTCQFTQSLYFQNSHNAK